MAVLQTYQVTTNKEDLTDVITNISPRDTPFLTRAKKTKAYNTLHETMKDELAAANKDNAIVEGADFQEDAMTMPGRVPSYTQVFYKGVKVSGSQQAVRTAGGIKNTYNYQVTKKLKEIALDIEAACVDGAGAAGDAATPRKLKGFMPGITTHVVDKADAALTEEDLNDVLEQVFSDGGKPDTVFTCPALKRAISAFTTPVQRTSDADTKKRVVAVDIYESDFGELKIIPHLLMPAKSLAVLQLDLWAIAWLRPTKHEPLPKNGDHVRGQIVAECTLEHRQEKGNGKIVNAVRN